MALRRDAPILAFASSPSHAWFFQENAFGRNFYPCAQPNGPKLLTSYDNIIINLLQNSWNLDGWTMAFGKNYEKDLFSLNFDVLVFCNCLRLIMKVLTDILFLIKILTALFNVSGRVGGVMLCFRRPIYTCRGCCCAVFAQCYHQHNFVWFFDDSSINICGGTRICATHGYQSYRLNRNIVSLR